MNVHIVVDSLVMTDIFTIPAGGCLVKGGKKKNPMIWAACEGVCDRYCCYYWRDDAAIRYVGSVTADYTSNQHRTNLCGRVSNYLQNHNGQTNKWVFDHVNRALVAQSIGFGIFRFKAIEIESTVYSFAQCADKSTIMQMLEEIQICRYRLMGQADWNRT